MNKEDLKIMDVIRSEEASSLIRGAEKAFMKLAHKDGNGVEMAVLSAEIYNGKITNMPIEEISAPLLSTFAEEELQGKSQELLANAYGREMMTDLVETNPFFFADCMLPTITENWTFSIPVAVCAFYHLPDGSYQACFRTLCTQDAPEYHGFLIHPGSTVLTETPVPVWASRFLDGAVEELPKVQQPEWDYANAAA